MPALAVQFHFPDEYLPALILGKIAGAAAHQVGGDDEEIVGQQDLHGIFENQAEHQVVGEHDDDVDDQRVDETGADEIVGVEGRQNQRRVKVRRRIDRLQIEDRDDAQSDGQSGRTKRQAVVALEGRVEGEREDKAGIGQRRKAEHPGEQLIFRRHQQAVEKSGQQVDKRTEHDRRPPLHAQARHQMAGEGTLDLGIAKAQRQGVKLGHQRFGHVRESCGYRSRMIHQRAMNVKEVIHARQRFSPAAQPGPGRWPAGCGKMQP